ncbi:olfactory receptor 1L4-like [Hyperolius riggenbachi]|uniref:olfactory receptor 1L4-like n=1 Tax=Hyperolius riggenbachi TaxID=752182 RepID=UPI0035A33D3D
MKHMEPFGNESLTGVILLGFSETPHLVVPLFCFFLAAYVLCIGGNTFLSMLIVSQPQLQTPMFILMGHLAFVDVCFTSIIIPRALYSLLSGDTHISIYGCFAQLFLFLAAGIMENFLLAIMAFDRYSAVCFPLHYLQIMSKRTCMCLVTIFWIIGFSHSSLYTALTSSQPHCSQVIHHFFCDLPVVVLLACSGTSDTLQRAVFTEGFIVIFGPMFFILGSYILIARAVLTLKSSQGRWKTFSTCTSHLTMVVLFYGTVIFIYFRPSSIYTPTYDRDISMVYSVINPMLNPFIYSLRNKEIKNAVRAILQRGRKRLQQFTAKT